MVKLYNFGPAFGLRETGPFAYKLMLYMKLAGIEYEVDSHGDPRKAPKKKIPYLEDDGKVIGDSSLILLHLKEKYGDPLGDGLSAEQHAAGHAVRIMLEERTYWAGIIYPRWVKTEHHRLLADTFFKEIPKFMRYRIFKMIAKGVAKAAAGHGIGAHSDEEIYAMGIADLKAFEAMLGDKPYLLGERPSEYDAVAAAFIAGMATDTFPTPIQEFISNSKLLSAYWQRVDQLAFPGA